MEWAVGAFCAFALTGLYQGLKFKHYQIASPKISRTRRVRFMLLADLHGKQWGKGQRLLLDNIQKLHPDAVLLAGDITEAGGAIELVIELIRGLVPVAPVFFTAGNHDLLTFDCDAFTRALESEGVFSLRDKTIPLSIQGETILLSGIDDPFQAFITGQEDAGADYEKRLRGITLPEEAIYRVLIAHRPEYAQLYAQSGFDLALCGHTHGGQIRLPPPLNGLYSSGQGLFPMYSAGEYQINGMRMIVSRGLHQTLTRPRFFNRPEAVVIDIFKEGTS